MARFLLLTGAAAGHVNPVMQIARKLIERGHEVSMDYGSSLQGKGRSNWREISSLSARKRSGHDGNL